MQMLFMTIGWFFEVKLFCLLKQQQPKRVLHLVSLNSPLHSTSLASLHLTIIFNH